MMAAYKFGFLAVMLAATPLACDVEDGLEPTADATTLELLGGSGKADGAAADETVFLTSVHSGYCLDVYGGGTADLTNAISWPCHGGANQKWELRPSGVGDSFLLVDSNSGKCLDVYGARTDDGTNVSLYECHGGPNQSWRFEPVRHDGKVLSYRIVDSNSDKCLDIRRASDEPGANVILHTCHDGPNQRFVLESTAGPRVELGRIVIPLLTLTNPRIDQDLGRELIVRLAELVRPKHAKALLVVRDDAHYGEFAEDPEVIAAVLDETFGDSSQTPGLRIDFIDEPSDGLRYADVEGYDVVWFSNPGHPIDDPRTLRTLQRYFALGNAVVLQGDDMSQSTRSLSHLDHTDNGDDFCGVVTNDNAGDNFAVALASDGYAGRIWGDLAGEAFLYGDDIDVSTAIGEGEWILATATLASDPSCDSIPAIVGRGNFGTVAGD
jgi:hypothetical protein